MGVHTALKYDTRPIRYVALHFHRNRAATIVLVLYVNRGTIRCYSRGRAKATRYSVNMGLVAGTPSPRKFWARPINPLDSVFTLPGILCIPFRTTPIRQLHTFSS